MTQISQMDLSKLVEDYKIIQKNVLDFLENDENVEEFFQNLIQQISDQKIRDDQHQLSLFLHLLTSISNNHHHDTDFYSKIEQIIQLFKSEISKQFSNSEIFSIFKANKRILLFVIKSGLIKIDKLILSKLTSPKYKLFKYPQYFFPEIKSFLDEEQTNIFDPHVDENFDEKRMNGENDTDICQIIQNDSLKEFITYINKNSFSLKAKIKPSIFETNLTLLQNENLTLIEYAAFYGSIQIFQYLKQNNVQFQSKLLVFAVHGCNSEIINLVENEQKESYKECLVESIKCHHNSICNYIINNNFIPEEEDIDLLMTNTCFKYYNFNFLKSEFINEENFFTFCKYGYFSFAEYLLKETDIDVNQIDESDKIVIENMETNKITDDEMFESTIIIPVLKKKSIERTPLFIAIKKQNTGIVKLLLSKDNIDVNVINKCLTIEKPAQRNLYPNEITTKTSALNMAIKTGNQEIVNLLLSKDKIDVNIKDIYNDLHKWGPGPEQGQYITEKPPLFIAFENEDMEVYKLLLSNDKIDVNSTKKDTKMNPYGIFENFVVNETSLLNMFVENEDVENIKLLLQNEKINVNLPNKLSTYSQYIQILRGRQTIGLRETEIFAIQIAIDKKNIEIINLLLKNKDIDVDIENEDDVELIDSTDDPEIKKLLNEFLSANGKKQQINIEPICTYEASGESMILQNFYICKTCGVNQHGNSVEGCCQVCANCCHKGHKLQKLGNAESFCDCPGSGKCKCNKHDENLKCTGEITNGEPANQPMYQCDDCGIKGNSYICQSCAINHHHGHKLIFKYKVKNGICCNYNHI